MTGEAPMDIMMVTAGAIAITLVTRNTTTVTNLSKEPCSAVILASWLAKWQVKIPFGRLSMT